MLPAIIVLSLIILAIAASMMTSGFIESFVSRTFIESQESFYLSESGIDDALLKIVRDRTLGEDILSEPWSLPTSGSSVVTVLGTATTRVINSVGIISEKQRSLETNVTLSEYGKITATTWEELIGIWYSLSWPYRKKVTFTSDSAKIPSAQIDFPVLINLSSDVDLAADAQDDGDDIFFTSYDGLTKLNHEIEKFDGATGELVAWVKVPSLSTSTIIYMYYGNATCDDQQNVIGVWDDNYVGVWHMGDAADTTVADSTGTYDGAAANGPTFEQVGQIGNSISFDGIDNHVATGAFTPPAGALTVSFWVKTDDITDRAIIAWKEDPSSGTEDRNFYIDTSSKMIFSVYYSGAAQKATSTSSITTGWHYIVGTIDTTNGNSIWFDGTSENTDADGIDGYDGYTTPEFYIGESQSVAYSANHFDGIIDEVRVSNTTRSTNWITTSFSNQNNPSTFYTLLKEIH